MLTHAGKSSTQVAKAGRLPRAKGQPGLHSDERSPRATEEKDGRGGERRNENSDVESQSSRPPLLVSHVVTEN